MTKTHQTHHQIASLAPSGRDTVDEPLPEGVREVIALQRYHKENPEVPAKSGGGAGGAFSRGGAARLRLDTQKPVMEIRGPADKAVEEQNRSASRRQSSAGRDSPKVHELIDAHELTNRQESLQTKASHLLQDAKETISHGVDKVKNLLGLGGSDKQETTASKAQSVGGRK